MAVTKGYPIINLQKWLIKVLLNWYNTFKYMMIYIFLVRANFFHKLLKTFLWINFEVNERLVESIHLHNAINATHQKQLKALIRKNVFKTSLRKFARSSNICIIMYLKVLLLLLKVCKTFIWSTLVIWMRLANIII